MKKLIATLFAASLSAQGFLGAVGFEVNTSYDYFRGIPDGSWNGNSGALVSGNMGFDLTECIGLQLGGSWGLYNWDGRENQVFKNPKALEQQAFITAGAYAFQGDFSFGLNYDRMYVKHFSIYDVSASFDQLRFQGGYRFCAEEVGVWGTAKLSTANKHALGLPVKFKAINQINVFWSHYFDNYAAATVWVGAPYGNSLRYHHKAAGEFDMGFSLRAPLTDCLYVDAHAAYMRARNASGSKQSRNYDSNVCVGLTYLFGDICSQYGATYMPVANNSNFFVDTNVNR